MIQEGDQICIIRETGTDPVRSDTTAMVCALVTLGVPFYEPQPYQETREIVDGQEKHTVTWCLQTKTEDGRFKTRELIQWWRDDAWLATNNEHPLAYAKAAIANYQRLTAGVKTSVPLAMVRKGKRFALIPFDATPERRLQLLNLLSQ